MFLNNKLLFIIQSLHARALVTPIFFCCCSFCSCNISLSPLFHRFLMSFSTLHKIIHIQLHPLHQQWCQIQILCTALCAGLIILHKRFGCLCGNICHHEKHTLDLSPLLTCSSDHMLQMQGWGWSLTLDFYIQILPSGLHTFHLVPVGRIPFTSRHSAFNCALLILSSEPRLCLPFILFPQEAELRSALEEMGLAWILSSVNLYFWSFCSTGRRAPAHAGRDGFSLNCLLFSFFNVLF